MTLNQSPTAALWHAGRYLPAQQLSRHFWSHVFRPGRAAPYCQTRPLRFEIERIHRVDRGRVVVVQFHRWRRFGYDRLYLTADDGVKLGYLDLADRDSPHLAASARTAEFYAGINRWRQLGRPDDYADTALTGIPVAKPRRVALRRQPTAPPPLTAPATPSPPPPTDTSGAWDDLALHRPGAGVAEVAAMHRKEHPVRTRLDRLRGKHTDAQAWAKGATGEQKTGKALARLTSGEFGQRWEALHSLTINARGGDIDHLLIGPAGIFTINTKHHPGKSIQVGPRTLTINGRDRSKYLEHAAGEASTARERLSAAGADPYGTWDVWSVIAFVGATVTGDQHLDQVLCLDVSRLAIVMANFASTHPKLTDADITLIHDIARRSTTWDAPPAAATG